MAEGFYDFTPGQVLTAAQVDDYLMRQAVMRFADSAARTTALSGVLVEGMMSYLKDTNAVEVYDGSAWVAVGAGLSYGTATGGSSSTITVGGESYTLLTFTTSANLTVTAEGVFDFVIVGGGGKGGEGYFNGASGGGGGGGGVITGTVGLTAGTHAIVIGAGGTTNLGGSGLASEPGSPSSLGAIEAAGGGGSCYLQANGNSISAHKGWAMIGGSGGGSQRSDGNFGGGGYAVGIQGNDGGDGLADIGGGASGGGGGGGYSSAGANGIAGTGGAGGNGYDPTTFTGSTITTAFGAGGGGAGSTTGGTGGSSSAGGDGGGATNGSAAANYGNGGGGADYTYTGGNGTNGIVLVRFKN